VRIVFRTDASIRIGTGHVMRCLTLAEVLRKRGADVTFVCRELEGNLIALIRDTRGFTTAALPTPDAVAKEEAPPFHAPWLEVPWQTDAAETAAVLRSLISPPDWIVLDHYALDARWEAAIKPFGGRLFVIDDIADRPHDCVYLLDQNLYDTPDSRYASRVPSATRLLLGPEFALLRPDFAAARMRVHPREGTVGRVLVFFGGADPGRDTLKAVEALSMPALRHLIADVVVGSVNPAREAVRRACESRPGTIFHLQVTNMAELMAAADLALGAGGTASWERCCLGLPSLLATVAENQRELTDTLARHGAAVDLGWGPDLSAEDIATALGSLLADPGRVASMSRMCLSLVDGSGASRTADRLLNPTPEKRRLRPALLSDMLTYFRWTNDPETRRQSFKTDPVPLKDHIAWFQARHSDPACRLYVLEEEGEPAGQIRFQREAEGIWISFSVDPRHRGRGLGAELLRFGPVHLRKDEPSWSDAPVLGAVKPDNAASHKAFLHAGYRKTAEGKESGETLTTYAYPEGKS
jgi:UDP-2,4-diacetamido-2,4,6-trideoxy-beta-L-altropyranose hydrolase